MTRLFVKQAVRLGDGQPKALSRKDIDDLVKVPTRMVVKAQGKYEITVAMLRREARVVNSTRLYMSFFYGQKQSSKTIAIMIAKQ